MDVQVVLTQDDPKLGKRGEVVKVAPGHAYNFLIPHAKAKLATPSNLKTFEAEKKKSVQTEAEIRTRAEELAKKINELSVTLEVQAGEGEKMYGSVTGADIQQALRSRAIAVGKKEIHLEQPIHKLGTFQVPIKLHREVSATLKLSIVKKK